MGLVKKSSVGIKILGRGKLSKKLTVKAYAFSDSAIKAIKKVKGKPIKYPPVSRPPRTSGGLKH